MINIYLISDNKKPIFFNTDACVLHNNFISNTKYVVGKLFEICALFMRIEFIFLNTIYYYLFGVFISNK